MENKESHREQDVAYQEGYALESVGTYLKADGWTYPMLVDDCNRYCGYAQWGGVHLRDIEPDGDWMRNLSDDDRQIVEMVELACYIPSLFI